MGWREYILRISTFLMNRTWWLTALLHFLIFSSIQRFPQMLRMHDSCLHYVKSKCVWFLFCDEQLAYEIIGFDILRLLAKWFWRWLVLQAMNMLLGLVRPGCGCWLDRHVLSGQTGQPVVWLADSVSVSVLGCFIGYPWIICVYDF